MLQQKNNIVSKANTFISFFQTFDNVVNWTMECTAFKSILFSLWLTYAAFNLLWLIQFIQNLHVCIASEEWTVFFGFLVSHLRKVIRRFDSKKNNFYNRNSLFYIKNRCTILFFSKCNTYYKSLVVFLLILNKLDLYILKSPEKGCLTLLVDAIT